MFEQFHLRIDTPGRGTTQITDRVNRALAESRLRLGLAHLFVQHTSASLLLNENADPRVRRDLETLLARWAPDGDPAYSHDDEGDDDMAAHARSMLTGTSLSVPFADGRLLLGTWQGIYLYEHRTSAQRRSLIVTLAGDPIPSPAV
ncbi:MAG: secondary thiamine-phosphate synthase enzyme YjbQ [Burkholderiaceae bacterium]